MIFLLLLLLLPPTFLPHPTYILIKLTHLHLHLHQPNPIQTPSAEATPSKPSFLERAVNEVDAADDFGWDSLQGMPFLHASIKEALRMFPPLIFLFREVVKERVTECGHTIAPGTILGVSTAVAMRLPEVFGDNANEYDPRRWSDFDIGSLPRYSFIGFGAGLHTCMGESFAFMQIKAVLSVLFEMYELEPVGETFALPNYDGIVVGPHGNTRVKYRRRTRKQEKKGAANNVVKEELAAGPTGAAAAAVPAAPAAPVAPAAPAATAAATPAATAPTTTDASINVMELATDSVFSREEIKKHRTATDCWLVVGNLVYDVTNFVRLHQGGEGWVAQTISSQLLACLKSRNVTHPKRQCAASPRRHRKGRERSSLRAAAPGERNHRSPARALCHREGRGGVESRGTVEYIIRKWDNRQEGQARARVAGFTGGGGEDAVNAGHLQLQGHVLPGWLAHEHTTPLTA